MACDSRDSEAPPLGPEVVCSIVGGGGTAFGLVFDITVERVAGEGASEAAAAVICCWGDWAASDMARGSGLSLEFEKDGLGSSLGAGEGRTFAGVLQGSKFVSLF